MDLESISEVSELTSDLLQARAKVAPVGKVTEWYRCVHGGGECAFVVLDNWPWKDSVILYELIVDPDQRKTGVGTMVLAAVEALAKARGRSRVRLRPHPLDDSISSTELVRWYTKRGYRAEVGDCHMYCKFVSG